MLSFILAISTLLSGDTEERLHACAMLVEDTMETQDVAEFDAKVSECLAMGMTVEQIEQLTDGSK